MRPAADAGSGAEVSFSGARHQAVIDAIGDAVADAVAVIGPLVESIVAG